MRGCRVNDGLLEPGPVTSVLRRLADMEDKIYGAPWKSNIFRRAYEHIRSLEQRVEELEGEKRGLKRCGLCGCMDSPVNPHGDCHTCASAQYGDE